MKQCTAIIIMNMPKNNHLYSLDKGHIKYNLEMQYVNNYDVYYFLLFGYNSLEVLKEYLKHLRYV